MKEARKKTGLPTDKARNKAELPTDFDNNIKEAIKNHLKEAVEFGDPVLAKEIDWSIEVEFLEQELRQVQRALFRGAKYCACW